MNMRFTDYAPAQSLQSCPTLCDPMDCSPPGSSVPGILQARIVEWVATSSSRGSSQPRYGTHVSWGSCSAGRFFTIELLGKPLTKYVSVLTHYHPLDLLITCLTLPLLFPWLFFPPEIGLILISFFNSAQSSTPIPLTALAEIALYCLMDLVNFIWTSILWNFILFIGFSTNFFPLCFFVFGSTLVLFFFPSITAHTVAIGGSSLSVYPLS